MADPYPDGVSRVAIGLWFGGETYATVVHGFWLAYVFQNSETIVIRNAMRAH